jgi:hypothetical protein
MKNGSNYLIGLSWLIPVLLLVVGKIYGKNEVLILSAVILACCGIFSAIDLLVETKKHSIEGGDTHGMTMAAITFFISIVALLFFRFTCDESVIDMVNNIISEHNETQSVETETVLTEPVPEETADIPMESNENTDFTVVKKIASISDSDNAEYQIYAERDGEIMIITVDKNEFDKIAVGDTYAEK